MLTTSLESVNHCVCDSCGHKWDSLTLPVTCPKCFTRTWNGAKIRGRPRDPLKPAATKPKRNRIKRKELPEYSPQW